VKTYSGDVLALAEECSDILMHYYSSDTVKKVETEVVSEPTVGIDSDRVDVYVKSIREVSLDELPIINSILLSLQDKRTVFYEYESIRIKEPRHKVLSKLISRSLKLGVPAIVVMPSALPVSLLNALNEDVLQLLDESLYMKINVTYENYFYLPVREKAGSIELVAKDNSKSSYERVEWLSSEAPRRGIEIKRVLYLPDNRSIFDYILGAGPQGIYERVPVNKLALYVLALSKCIGFSGLEMISRIEKSTHLLYAVNLDYETLSKIRENVSHAYRMPPLGLLFSSMRIGASKVFSEIISRLL